MKTISTATMKLDRVTKGAVLYKDAKEDGGTALTSIYLRKIGLAEPFPPTITVTIAIEGDE